MKNIKLKKLIFSAFFLALGITLPFLTGQIQHFGNMLLPMHIPVFLCGLICGWQYGAAVGFVTPLLRSIIFGMPIMYPHAAAMAFELLTYGAVAGFLYSRSQTQNIKALYMCLIAAMVSGRIIWGIAEAFLLGITKNYFTVNAFISGALLNAAPGILLQLILIPTVMVALRKSKLITFKN